MGEHANDHTDTFMFSLWKTPPKDYLIALAGNETIVRCSTGVRHDTSKEDGRRLSGVTWTPKKKKTHAQYVPLAVKTTRSVPGET